MLVTVQRAARRRLLVLLIEELPFALALLAGTEIGYLLVGTAILQSWVWICAVCLTGALLAFQIRRQLLASYEVAQLVDRRLQLQDSLSTAWFVLHEMKAPSALAAKQLEQANSIARTVDPRRAFPAGPLRSWALPGSLLVIGAVLAVVRSSHPGGLDLRASLVPVPARSWAQTVHAWEQKLANAHVLGERTRSRTHERGGSPEMGERGRSGTPVSTADGQGSRTAGAPTSSNSSAGEASLEQLEKQFSPDQSTDDNRNLLARMQDALGGMMAKAEQKLVPRERNEGQPSAQQQQGASSESGGASKSNQSGSRQEGQDAQAKAASNSVAHAIEKSSSSMLGNDSQPAMDSGNSSESGAGRNDGQKDIRGAQELKAIGKLTELIGKRSAAITGEMTIAKPSRNPQLATPYSERMGDHEDRGEEIDTDEIPPEYRDFVRAYMEAVHQHPPAAQNPPRN